MNYATLIDAIQYCSEKDTAGVTFIPDGKGEVYVSYRRLYEDAWQQLGYLQEKGLKPRQELIFQVDDAQTFVTLFWACLLGGIIPVPLSPGIKDHQRRKLFSVWNRLHDPFLAIDPMLMKKVKAFAVEANQQAIVSQMEQRMVAPSLLQASGKKGVIREAKPDDIAFVQFSSGSTGNSKGISLTHRNLLLNLDAISTAAAYTTADSLLSWMPLTHDMGLIGFHLNPVFCNIPHYLIPVNLFIRRPALWLEKAAKHRVSVLCSPNFGYNYVLKHWNSEAARELDLSQVRIIYNGAEPISISLCEAFNSAMAPYGLRADAMLPVYGLAEASLAVSVSDLKEKAMSLSLLRKHMRIGGQVIPANAGEEGTVKVVNVGRPVKHCAVRIVDTNEEPLPDNCIGLLQIKGGNVTAGYYNDEVATTQAKSGDNWLHTGDLAFMAAGNLYITGRRKDILFYNGQNYYPHDLEEVAEKVEGVALNKIAVAGMHDPASGKEEVIVFVLYRGAIADFMPIRSGVIAAINREVGFAPDHVLPVPEIPKTTSGKIERFRLLEQYREGAFRGEMEQIRDQQALQNKQTTDMLPEEATMVAIWQEVLGVPVSVEDRFFEIGGDSLKVATLMMLIQQTFGKELPLNSLYQYQTVRELVPALTAHAFDGLQSAALPTGAQAVSPAQSRIFFACELDPLSTAYNIPVAFKLQGKISRERLEAAVNKLIQRHDALRMCFMNTDNGPVYTILPEWKLSVDEMTVMNESLDTCLQAWIRPFDLTASWLLRIALAHLHEETFLWVDISHIIADGISISNFISELTVLYDGGILPALPFTYHDVLQSAPARQEHGDYWQEQLAETPPVLELPTDFKRPVIWNSSGEKLFFAFTKAESAALSHLAASEHCTLHVMLLTAYRLLLAAYSGQENITTGIPVGGRTQSGTAGIMGMLVNNLVISGELPATLSFSELLQQEQQHITAALRHQDYPFSSLAASLAQAADPGRHPLFDTMFIYQDMQADNFVTGDFKLVRQLFDPGIAKYDLSLEIFYSNSGIQYAFEYATSLFEQSTIQRMAAHFQQLLKNILQDINAPLQTVSLLLPAESDHFINGFNATQDTDPEDAGILQRFTRQAALHPHHTAVMQGSTRLSYQTLDDLAGRMAGRLLPLTDGRNEVVAILLERSPLLITGLLGIMKAGAAFLLIDVTLPAERIAYMLRNSQAKVVITSKDMLEHFSQVSCDYTCILADEPLPLYEPAAITASADDIAYMLYTSGSTGYPKGVIIRNDALSNYIRWASDYYVKDARCDFPLFTAVSFDLTLTSVFTPLISGNTIVIYEERDNELLIETVLRDNKVDIIKLTPSHLLLLKELPAVVFTASRVRQFIVGGELFESRLAMEICKKFPHPVALHNEYGPTEATVGCMIHTFHPLTDTGHRVLIGAPIYNTQIYLLDKYLRPVATGVTGEIYIAGKGVAAGYQGLDTLTAQRFVPNPFAANSVMYRTGDLAKRCANGLIDCIGRTDSQVKINGVRIELQEIEMQLVQYPGIREVVVLAPGKILHAFYTGDEIPDAGKLRDFLVSRLPYYMIPVKFTHCKAFPANRNGKLDQEALLKYETTAPLTEEVLPVGEVETILLEVWQHFFNQPALLVTDNFFAIGGDSIKAVQLAARLLARQLRVQARIILTLQSIREISRFVETCDTSKAYTQGILTGTVPLPPAASWLIKQQLAVPGMYTQSVALDFNEPPDPHLLGLALDILIAHHDGLRMNCTADMQALFYNNRHLDTRQQVVVLEAPGLDIGEVGLVQKDPVLAPLYTFDIHHDLLIRIFGLHTPHGTKFYITAHHLVMDGVSWRIFLEDLHLVCAQLAAGNQPLLPPKTASVTDWTLVLATWKEQAAAEAPFWQQQEAGEELLPVDMVTNDHCAGNLAYETGELNETDTRFLLADAHKIYATDTLMLLNAAMAIALHQWTGANEFTVEQESHGRLLNNLDTVRTIGWFTAMYPLRLSYHHNSDTLIKHTKELMRAIPKGGIGHGLLSTAAGIPLVRLNYLGDLSNGFSYPMFNASPVHGVVMTARENRITAVLECNSMVIADRLHINISYNQKSFKAASIARFTRSFINALSEILRHIRQETEIHFTSSDFDGLQISQKELDALFD
ncbi:surfactin family lipopeptide synthetase A [Chitinophaga costaii]|uniref:Surfactin family lipopeptide synthetase A n=1 Tax=Chitinophaga costaii TaxID=1335309 RepID=A0A1C3YU65_9BACT|nr:non-ribosomal peptide synthetase [Chitinophaga costaii]PUZ30108.1 amino acid adenylation domain-containing protein [Chitinophaga costaii]SCB73647.1 surfactin family lipopeptide synthetase A [Chitinophaga costaii]